MGKPNGIRAKTYAEKLRDPRWQKKRLQLLNRAGFRCEHCGYGQEELHVHHKIYRKGCEIWDYKDDEFIVLCLCCHQRITEELDCIRERMACLSAAGIAALSAILDFTICHFQEDWEYWVRWMALKQPWEQLDIEQCRKEVEDYRTNFHKETGGWPEHWDRDGSFMRRIIEKMNHD